MAGCELMHFGGGGNGDVVLPVVVLNLKGSARYATEESGSHNLKPWQQVKDSLPPVAVVQTAAGSWMDLGLGTPRHALTMNSTNVSARWPKGVRLFENTLVRIDKSTRKGKALEEDLQLDLRTGRLLVRVTQLTGASRFEVRVAKGVVLPREGACAIGADGSVSVLQGAVLMTLDGADETFVIQAGRQFEPGSRRVVALPDDVLNRLVNDLP
jgi:hypothetical protein